MIMLIGGMGKEKKKPREMIGGDSYDDEPEEEEESGESMSAKGEATSVMFRAIEQGNKERFAKALEAFIYACQEG